MLSLFIAMALSGASQDAPDIDAPDLEPRTERSERSVPSVPPEADEGMADPKSAKWKLHDQETLAFMRIDRNDDDVVTADELRSYYSALYRRVDLSRDRKRNKIRSSVTTYIRVYDMDGSGDVSFAEVVDGGMLRDRRIERSSQTFS